MCKSSFSMFLLWPWIWEENMKILGLVNESNGYYNFKPLYELKNNELLELADHTIEDLEENRNSYGELNQTAYKLNAPKLID